MPRKILVIDDDALLRSAICTHLREQGFEAEESGTGKEARAALEVRQFALVVSDILLPDIDGLQLIRYLKKQHPTTKVIAMTGYPDPIHLENAKRFGAHFVLAKPFELSRLAEVAQELTGDATGS